MDTNQKLVTTDKGAKLSTAWIFVLLNVVFRDLHELFRPGYLQEIMTGTVNDVQLTEGTLLLGGIVLEIPIAMVILSRILNYRVNRWANLVAGAAAVSLFVTSGLRDLDDVFFATVVVVSVALIVLYAWTKPKRAA